MRVGDTLAIVDTQYLVVTEVDAHGRPAALAYMTPRAHFVFMNCPTYAAPDRFWPEPPTRDDSPIRPSSAR